MQSMHVLNGILDIHKLIVAFTKALESFSQGDNCTYKQTFT